MRLSEIASRPGQRLPNGAILIAEVVQTTPHMMAAESQRSVHAATRKSVVLAMQGGAVEPFTTWLRQVEFDILTLEVDSDITESGSYHRHIDKAVRDFRKRTKA
jgi:hypothetical protein